MNISIKDKYENYNDQIDSDLLQLPRELFLNILRFLPDLTCYCHLRASCIKAKNLTDSLIRLETRPASLILSKVSTLACSITFIRLIALYQNKTPTTLVIDTPHLDLTQRLVAIKGCFSKVTTISFGPQVAISDTELMRLSQFSHLRSLSILSTCAQKRALRLSVIANTSLEKLVVQGLQDEVTDLAFTTLLQNNPALSWLELTSCQQITPMLTTELKVARLEGMRHTTKSFLATLFRDEICVTNAFDIAAQTFEQAQYSKSLTSATFCTVRFTAKALDTLLKQAGGLQRLSIGDCTEIFKEQFCQIKWSATLVSIALDGTECSDEGLAHLLKQTPKLTTLSVKNCKNLTRSGCFHVTLPRTFQSMHSPFESNTAIEVHEQLEQEKNTNAHQLTSFAIRLWDKQKTRANKEKALQLLAKSITYCPNYLLALKVQEHLS